MSSSNSCLCARTKWRLCPHQKLAVPGFCRAPPDNEWSCFLRRSTPTLRRRLTNERWLWALRFSYFPLNCLYFFLPFYVTSGGFELRLIIFPRFFVYNFFSCFHNSWFFWFAQYCLSKFPLLCMGEGDKSPTNKIYRRASSEQRPRTRSGHESKSLVWPFFRSNVPVGKSFFWSSSRAARDFSQRRPENSLSS